MKVSLTERAIAALAGAQPAVQKAFIKQINFLARNLQQPSLHAKKYDESQDLWQARINDDWRFYFNIARVHACTDSKTPFGLGITLAATEQATAP